MSCVPASCTLRQALATLDQTARGVLLVLHPDGRLRRTLTDGDLRRAALEHVQDTAAVADLPEQPPITVGTDATLAQGLAVLDEHVIDHLPVVDAEGLVGVISIGDLVNSIIQAQAQTIEHLQTYIGANYPV